MAVMQRLALATASLTTGLALVLGPATTAPARAAVVDPVLQTKIATLMTDWRVKAAIGVGAMVLDADSGGLVYSRASQASLTPASTMKLITAAAALRTLGTGFRFHTDLYATAPIRSGTLTGDLYVKGFGDPTTMSADYANLAGQLRARGVTSVSGRIVADASYFDDQRYHPAWSTSWANDYYAPQTSALTIAPTTDYDAGTIIVRYTPAATVGARPRLDVVPASAASAIRLVNQATTSSAGSGDTIRVVRTLGTNTITVSGRIAVGRGTGRAFRTVDNPLLVAAAVLRGSLNAAGIRVAGGNVAGTTPVTGRTRLAVDYSITLSQLLVPFLKLSNNSHAEALVKTMGALRGRPGNWADGLAYNRAWLVATGANLDPIVLSDGSGLSHANKVTAQALALTLRLAKSQPWYSAYKQALPIAGNPGYLVGGSLRSRLVGTVAANRTYAKTGWLSGVNSIAGYIDALDGHHYLFVMLTEYRDYWTRPVEDRLCVTIAGHVR